MSEEEKTSIDIMLDYLHERIIEGDEKAQLILDKIFEELYKTEIEEGEVRSMAAKQFEEIQK